MSGRGNRIVDLKYTVGGLAICMLAGALIHYFFGLEYWLATLIVGLALLANGLIGIWEDRGTFND